MSEITKVMRDDHARFKRLFLRATQAPESLDIALDLCDELTIHTTIEDEIVYPALARLDPGVEVQLLHEVGLAAVQVHRAGVHRRRCGRTVHRA
ncbi:MAG: hemerythrin domain-containing protein, partial [Acidimicrobiales bacterium]